MQADIGSGFDPNADMDRLAADLIQTELKSGQWKYDGAVAQYQNSSVRSVSALQKFLEGAQNREKAKERARAASDGNAST
jgi:hypothetical protein